MSPTAAAYGAMRPMACRSSAQRHGLCHATRISAPTAMRQNAAPSAPSAGNRVLANAVPTQSDIIDASRASSDRVVLGRG